MDVIVDSSAMVSVPKAFLLAEREKANQEIIRLSARIKEFDALLVGAGATVLQNVQSPTSVQSSAAAVVNTQSLTSLQPGAGAADSETFCCSVIAQDVPIVAEWPDFGMFFVKSDAPAFSEIVRRVAMSLPNFKVMQVRRVWNRQLWDAFKSNRSRVAAKNGGDAGAKLLFHGSDHMTLQRIVGSSADIGLYNRGFDPRLSNRGEYSEPHCASYFAQYAAYPVKINPRLRDGPICTVLLAEVICGCPYNCGRQCQRFARPPGDHDSVVGTENGIGNRVLQDWSLSGKIGGSAEEMGKQFVIFDRDMAYPHFIISLCEMQLMLSASADIKESPSSTFEFEECPERSGAIVLKSIHGSYKSITERGDVVLASVYDNQSMFSEEQLEGAKIGLRNEDGKWLSARSKDTIGSGNSLRAWEEFTKECAHANGGECFRLVSTVHVQHGACLTVSDEMRQ
jgi:hypothetical protein